MGMTVVVGIGHRDNIVSIIGWLEYVDTIRRTIARGG